MKQLLLIDANSIIHRSFHALPPFTGPAGEPTGALYGVASILLKLWRED
jgi:DNA polymerase-1